LTPSRNPAYIQPTGYVTRQQEMEMKKAKQTKAAIAAKRLARRRKVNAKKQARYRARQQQKLKQLERERDKLLEQIESKKGKTWRDQTTTAGSIAQMLNLCGQAADDQQLEEVARALCGSFDFTDGESEEFVRLAMDESRDDDNEPADDEEAAA
jgi:hypothetical protein